MRKPGKLVSFGICGFKGAVGVSQPLEIPTPGATQTFKNPNLKFNMSLRYKAGFKQSLIKMAKETTKETKLIRLVDRDIIGDTSTYLAITKVRGTDFMFSNAICNILNIPKEKPIQDLSPEDIKKIEDVMRNPKKYNIPEWLLNRRKDPETGENRHLVSADLKLTQQFDIRHLRKMKCYRGVRHARGLRVRGQRTRSTGRKGKAIGVARKKGKKK